MGDSFERLSLFYGENKVNKLKNSKVLIIGLGGVGGYITEALVRCGISNVTLVDYDTVDITNINRQIIANYNTLGLKKTECFRERIKSINPECNVKVIDEFIDENNFYELLFQENYDFVADAIDCVKTKKCIIKYCLENNINIISSMGTGNRENPSDLEIIDIMKTKGDPIARNIRKYLRDNKIKGHLKVLCSLEVPKNKIHGKIPSNSFVPSSAGLLIASYIVKELVKD